MSGPAPSARIHSLVRSEDQKCVFRSISSGGTRVLWEITSACNLRCDFCLVENKRGHVSLDRALEMARELVECGVDKFLISGGEPLLYPGIEELLRHLVDAGVLVKLLTNGTVRKPGVFELVRNSQNVEVSLSIHSTDDAVQDAIFGWPGAAAAVREAVRELPRERLNIITAFTTLNLDDVEAVIDWVAAEGIPCVSVTNVFQDSSTPARFRQDCLVYRASKPSVDALFALLARKREQYADRLAIRTTQFRGGDEELCGAGRSVFYLDSNGDLLPCTLTHNARYAKQAREMKIAEAIDWYRRNLPETPPSACVDLLDQRIP